MGNNNQNSNENQASQDINQLLKVRREKLAALQEAGKDPLSLQNTTRLITQQIVRVSMRHLRLSFLQAEQKSM